MNSDTYRTMPFTVVGDSLRFPSMLWSKIVTSSKIDRNDVVIALKEAQQTHQLAVEMVAKIGELEEENRRLRHENEFMVNLIKEMNDV